MKNQSFTPYALQAFRGVTFFFAFGTCFMICILRHYASGGKKVVGGGGWEGGSTNASKQTLVFTCLQFLY